MNEILDKASAHLTGKDYIIDTNTNDLEKLAYDHPYFSVTQVLLAKKYKAEDHPAFLTQVQKAALYFNNPYWLHFQMMDVKEELSFPDNQNLEPAHSVATNEDDHQRVLEQTDVQSEEKEQTTFTNDEIFSASNLARETLSRPSPENDEETEEASFEITPDEMHPEKEEILEEIQEQEASDEVETQSVDEGINRDGSEDYSLDESIAPIQPGESGEQQLEDSVVENVQAPEDVPEEIITEDVPVEKDEIEKVVETNLVHPVSIEEDLTSTVLNSNEINNELPQTTDEGKAGTGVSAEPTITEPLIPIEPYYTVDYFASQGIKLQLEKNPQDKLGKQLRSFTDWLKHMKKLGPEDALKSTHDTEVDPAIKSIADTSNKPEEIITESMADVLVKQGKNEQAIELYNKLSFLNPDKSPYFANQIQKLKDL